MTVVDVSVGSIVAWVLLLLVMGGCAALSVIAALTRARPLAGVAAGLLAIGVLIAALPATRAPLAITVIVTVAALVAAVAGGDPLTRWVLGRVASPAQPEDVQDAEGERLLRGGQVIGLLERLAVAGAVVAGFPEALAVIVAIKGVGRFSDLETSAVRERFIVGTLTSWIWAGGCAVVVLLTR